MKCPFCDSTFTVESLQYLDQPLSDEINDSAAPKTFWTPEEAEGLFVYVCSSCAGAVVADSTLGSTSCPYCGNPVVITDRFRGQLKPDLVLPFQLTRDQARAALMNHYRNKPYLPLSFKDDNRIDEVKGVYVPVWLFDSTIVANAAYNTTNIRRWSDSRYDYTETKRYRVTRFGTVEFLQVPVDGSQKLEDTLMESIEPYDYSGLMLFQTAYLSGYVTDIYDVDFEAALPRAQERMLATTREVMNTSVHGYSTVETVGMNIDFNSLRCQYALLPVWLLSTVYNGRVQTFAMNGQTGAFVGDLPIDRSIRSKSFLKVMTAAAAVMMIIALVLGWTGVQ
jgi:DNA-directed RNA polymerase subunit RPC12/RpoP